MVLETRVYGLINVNEVALTDVHKLHVNEQGMVLNIDNLQISDEGFDVIDSKRLSIHKVEDKEDLRATYESMINGIARTIAMRGQLPMFLSKGLTIIVNSSYNKYLGDHGNVFYFATSDNSDSIIDEYIQRLVKMFMDKNFSDWGAYLSDIDNFICLLEARGDLLKDELNEHMWLEYRMEKEANYYLADDNNFLSTIEDGKKFYMLLMSRWFILRYVLEEIGELTPFDAEEKVQKYFSTFLELINPTF